MSQDNRILGRVGARELTRKEMEQVTGGLQDQRWELVVFGQQGRPWFERTGNGWTHGS
jgi:hypothetical protein